MASTFTYRFKSGKEIELKINDELEYAVLTAPTGDLNYSARYRNSTIEAVLIKPAEIPFSLINTWE